MVVKLLIGLLVVYAGWWLWRGPKRAAPRPRAIQTTAAEADARAILGVGPQADADAIRAAHRRLMVDAHPDRGGPAERARELNAARDLLLSAIARIAA